MKVTSVVSCANSMLPVEDYALLLDKSWLVFLVRKMEEKFLAFHGPQVKDFNRLERVNERLTNDILNAYKCDTNLTQFFVRQRLFMRLRDFNIPIRNASLNCSNKSYAKYVA